MSIAKGNQPVVGQSDLPTWDERYQFFKMRRWFRFLIATVVILWLLLIVWVLFIAPITKATVAQVDAGANLLTLLAPVLIVGLAVERTLEITFNVLEGSWRTMVAYLGRGVRWLKYAEIEVMQARQFLADASDMYNMEMQSIQFGQASISVLTDEVQAKIETASKLMVLAQQRLADAEGNLAAATSSGIYIRAKASASIILGLLLGLITSGVLQLQMFAILGIGYIPARIDVLVTGLIIGASALPIHSVITNLGSLVNRIGSAH